MNKFNNHLIYVYEFPNNVCYVGQTVNLKKRHSYHVRDKRDTVCNYIIQNDIKNFEPKILEQNLKMISVKKKEDFWIEVYQEKGYHLLNKIKGGAVGSKNNIIISEIKKYAKKSKNKTELKKKYSWFYKKAHELNIINKLTFKSN